MIFVVSGTQKFQFDRLFIAIDNLICDGKINDEVFAQIGSSNYIPQKYQYGRFISNEVFDSYINKADLIIAHSGIGVIKTSIRIGKPVVVIPRLAKFGEHVDDHQLEIAEIYSNQNFLEVCYDEKNLEVAIENAKTKVFAKYETDLPMASDIIEKFLKEGNRIKNN